MNHGLGTYDRMVPVSGRRVGRCLPDLAFVEVKYPESVKMRVAGRIIAPIFLGIGLVMLMLDAEAGLHNPLRFFWLIANPGSVMTLGVYFICVFMPVALVSALLEVLKKRVPKWLT